MAWRSCRPGLAAPVHGRTCSNSIWWPATVPLHFSSSPDEVIGVPRLSVIGFPRSSVMKIGRVRQSMSAACQAIWPIATNGRMPTAASSQFLRRHETGWLRMTSAAMASPICMRLRIWWHSLVAQACRRRQVPASKVVSSNRTDCQRRSQCLRGARCHVAAWTENCGGRRPGLPSVMRNSSHEFLIHAAISENFWWRVHLPQGLRTSSGLSKPLQRCSNVRKGNSQFNCSITARFLTPSSNFAI